MNNNDNDTANKNDDDASPSCPPQFNTTKKRRRFTIQEKRCLVRSIRRRMESGQVSLRTACKDANVHQKQYLTWKKGLNLISEASNIEAKSLCLGRLSILKSIEKDLLNFVFELREQGMGVSTSMVMSKAASLSRDFREKSKNAQYHATRRFMKSHGMVHRVATHKSQKDPRKPQPLDNGKPLGSDTMPVDIQKLETRLFINGEFVDAVSGRTFDTVNPATEEVICSVQEGDAGDIDKAVAAAKAAFDLGSTWRTMDGTGRRDLLLKLASLMERDRAYLEELESLDNGKPLGREGQYGSAVDVQLAISFYRYYAGWADKISGLTIPVDGNVFCYTRKEAIGVCGAIIPWNFPILMQAWKMAPALAAGNTIVVKTSEKTPLSALYVSKLVQEAGFPAGVVNTVSGYGPTAGKHLACHPDVDKIAFTGSTIVGQKIQEYASQSNLKSVSLELGGKSPLIVFDDADIEQALDGAHVGLFLNQGQACCASSRLFVQDTIYDKFVEAAVERAKKIKVGPSTETSSDQGPQVDKLQFDRVMNYIEKGKAEGATVKTGGSRHGEKGYFIQPTVFSDVKDDMTIAKEEIFGPVMSILKFTTDKEAVERANSTCYGLAAGVFSKSAARALGVANQLRAGTVWVNMYDNFDAAAPFGGYKMSGHGRDKGADGLLPWMETKCVMLPLDGPKC